MTPPFPRAFTIMEVLVVLTIIGILAALAIPAIGPLMRGYNLTTASSMIADELTFTHQAALTQNTDIEFRMYQVGSGTSGNDPQYRAVRAVVSATGQALDTVKYLPSPVIISSNPQLSSLLDYTNASRSGMSTNMEMLPPGNMTSYVSFKFRATGGTSLTPVTPPTGLWYMALYLENSSTNSNGLPSNYVTVQVDPVTGSVKTYRP